MDMEEALDNLSSTFRNVDQDILREILEEADGDYQLAVSSCKKAIFEDRL
jgi:predicted DNA-binding protein